MAKSIFEYEDYKIYVRERLKEFPKRGHGIQARIAQALSCQSTYISRVLRGESDFSLEQGEALAKFLALGQEECHYLLLLLQIARAGSSSLRQYFESQITEVQNRRMVLKSRLKIEDQLSDQNKAKYYSSWYYPAIHIALTISDLQSKEALSQRLGLPIQVVATALEFLLGTGLATQEGHRFMPGKTRIHLGSDSPLIGKSHINWRLQAVRSLEAENIDDLHYSSVVSLSRTDWTRIKLTLIKMIEEVKEVIKVSPEEELCCFAMDFFKV